MFGGTVGTFFYLRFRRPTQQWKCHIFEKTKERMSSTVDERGKIIYDYGDLYGVTKTGNDILERKETKDGKTHFWLKKNDREIQNVGTDCIIDKNTKEIIILKHDDEFSLIRPVINHEKIMLFEVVPHDVKNLMRSEMTYRSQQYKDQLTGWSAIAPYVFGAIAFFSIVMLVFVIVNGATKIQEMHNEREEKLDVQSLQIAQIMQDAVYIARGYTSELKTIDEIRQEVQAKQNDAAKKEAPPDIGVI